MKTIMYWSLTFYCKLIKIGVILVGCYSKNVEFEIVFGKIHFVKPNDWSLFVVFISL
jgi:hypothetical protein